MDDGGEGAGRGGDGLDGDALGFPSSPHALGEPVTDCLGMVVPGRPIVTEFIAIESSRMVVDVPAPASVASLSFFFLPGALGSSVGEDKGISIHWAAPPFDSFQLLGTLAPDRPRCVRPWRAAR
jgi:hypothetical protein